MNWHYQSRKVIYRHKGYDEVQFELVEAYPAGETVDSVSVYSDSQEGLAKWLRMAADDVEKYSVIDGGVIKQ